MRNDMIPVWDGNFYAGSHRKEERKFCVMEAVAYIAGEEHSDHPMCASPVISAFVRIWNDSIADDARRRDLLSQFVFRLPGTRAAQEIETQRSFMCLDWVIRVFAPAFLRLVPSLVRHADALASCSPVVDLLSLKDTEAAREAAWEAAWEASGAAASGAAAGVAAWEAAWEAAAWAASGTTTQEVLRTTVDSLQDSAVHLVERMIQLTEPRELPLTAKRIGGCVVAEEG